MTIPQSHAYAVIDIEGNGHSPPDIVEIAIVSIDNAAIGATRSWLVRPPHPIAPIVTRKVHGIRNTDVADSPSWPDIQSEVSTVLAGRIPVAHNARVEYDVLRRHLPDWKPELVLDTLKLAKAVWPGHKDHGGYGLDALLQTANITDGTQDHRRHRAGYDAYATAQLFLHLIALLPAPDQLPDVAAITVPGSSTGVRADQQESLW